MREAGLALIDRMPPKLAGSAETIGRQAYGRLRRVRRAMGRLRRKIFRSVRLVRREVRRAQTHGLGWRTRRGHGFTFRASTRLVKTLPRSVQRALRRFWFRFLASQHGDFRTRTVALDGHGPIVMVDARGVDLDEIVERILSESHSYRLVVLVSDPIVHRTRDLPALVEYVPSFRGFPTDLLSQRIAEIKRVYAVENVITWNVTTPFGDATSIGRATR
jgi:hypothetical protein